MGCSGLSEKKAFDVIFVCVEPVESVVVVDEAGQQRLTFVGPYLQNQTLRLTCTARGGNKRLTYLVRGGNKWFTCSGCGDKSLLNPRW